MKTTNNLLDKDDNKHCDVLCSIIQTYCHLASSNEPNIFNINQDQKHIFTQQNHFASKNWEEHKHQYQEHCHLAIKKSLTTRFISRPCTKLKFPVYSIDTNICDKLKNTTQDDNAPLDVQKNNWLHLDKAFFPNTMQSSLVLVFYWPSNCY